MAYKNEQSMMQTKSVAVASVTLEQLEKAVECLATLEDYQTHPNRYIQRVHPERLNWGVWMDIEDLAQAGLMANRKIVPGDWDYKGLPAETEEGGWITGELSATVDVRN